MSLIDIKRPARQRPERAAPTPARDIHLDIPAGPIESEGEWHNAIGGVGEIYFAGFAPELYKRGWTCYPQESTGNRRPWQIDGSTLAWKPFQTERPDPGTFKKWVAQAPGANVAVILGPSSGHVLAFDIDVTDEDLSLLTEELLEEIAGPTKYKRIGNPPKIALFYRLAEECSFTTKAIHYAEDEEGTVASPHAVEILGKHASITFYGTHHSTGRMFGWNDQPASCTPLDLPLITEEQIFEFIERMAELRPIYNPQRTVNLQAGPEFGELGPGQYRDVSLKTPNGWAVDERTGLVVEGREKFLLRYTYSISVANLPQIPTQADVERLIPQASKDFAAKISRTGKWASDHTVYRRVAGHIRRMAEKMATPSTNDSKPPKSRLHEKSARRGTLPTNTMPTTEGGGWPFTASPAADNPSAPFATTWAEKTEAQILSDREDRRLLTQEERLPCRADATADNEEALVEHLLQVAQVKMDPKAKHDTIANLSGAGTGKTATSIVGIANDYGSRAPEDTTVQINGKDAIMRRKHVVMVRDHSMAEEKSAFLKEVLGDKIRLIPQGALEATPDEPGVVQVGIARGTDRTACHRKKLREALIAEEVSPAGLCSHDVQVMNEAGELVTETRKCVFWTNGTCEAKAQPKANRNVQILFTPHAYETTSSIPTFISRATEGQIVDEDVTLQHAQVAYLSLANLQLPRSCAPTDYLRSVGYNSEADVAVLREQGIELAMAMLHDGKWKGAHGSNVKTRLNLGLELAIMDEIAEAPALYDLDPNGQYVRGQDILAACRASVSRDDPRTMEVRPLMVDSDEAKDEHDGAIAALVARKEPRSAGVSAERQFWQVIQELYDDATKIREAVKTDRVNHLLMRWSAQRILADAGSSQNDRWDAEEVMRREIPRLDKHAIPNRLDSRFQRVLREPARGGGGKTHHVRISKRLKPNLPNVPLLVLDASANVDRMKKIWKRDVREIGSATTVPHHLKTVVDCSRSFSPSSLLPDYAKDGAELIKRKLDTLDDLRKLITISAFVERKSRILVVTNRKVRKVLNNRKWASPGNISWLHFGGLRGRDFAKDYAGIIVIGRSQMVIGDIDAGAAAFGHDDEIPYAPYDKRGDCMLNDKDTLFRDKDLDVIQMRDGNDLNVIRDFMPEGGGRDLERAWREEEIYQSITRLRTAHRKGDAPWAILLGRIVPAGVVVDLSTTLTDLIRAPFAREAEAARLAGELVNPPGFEDIDSSLDNQNLPAYEVRAQVERRAVEIMAAKKSVSRHAATVTAWNEHEGRAGALNRVDLYTRARFSAEIIAIADDEEVMAARGMDLAEMDKAARARIADIERGKQVVAIERTDSVPEFLKAPSIVYIEGSEDELLDFVE